MGVDLSVIICTYNGANNIRECIAHLLAQEGVDGLRWEIVVVDNNSTDATADVVHGLMRDASIPIRYVFEPRQGTTYARNKGITETNGPCLAFIDDDILVSEQWLAAIEVGMMEQDRDVVAGRIHLHTPSPLPAWIQPDMYGFLGYRDFGDAPRELNGSSEFPFAGNMSFQRRVVDRVGMFDTNLGKRGKGENREAFFKGGETDFFQRLARAGATFCYRPDAIGYHKVLPFQINKKYFRKTNVFWRPVVYYSAPISKFGEIFSKAYSTWTRCGIPSADDSG